MNGFQIRAVQLDLARQMETTDYIRGFIDYAASSGYNTLLLYLEGRVRTAHFPYPKPEDSYTPDQMRALVKYATARGIDVVPATQALAHAELFLSHPELQPLSELRDTHLRGRWVTPARVHETFCPSLEETREFLAGYLEELAAIFPSPYLHVGLDEAWHIGVCDRCRARPEGQEGIWIEFIEWLHAVVTGRLGKRMMVWDDMFQHYPGALPVIPKDIVLCCWHYDAVIASPLRWHFGDRMRVDKLTVFSKLGFDCLIAPADSSWGNPVTLTRYAADRPCLGGLLTQWEKAGSFYEESLPVVGATGRLWKGLPPEEAFRQAVDALFGVREPRFADAIQAFSEIHHACGGPDSRAESYLRGPLTEEQVRLKGMIPVLLGVLESFRERVTVPLGSRVLEDILARLEQGWLRVELREVVPAFFQPGKPASTEMRQRLQEALTRIESLRVRRLAFWDRVRPGVSRLAFEGHAGAILDNLKRLPDRDGSGLMRLTLYLDNIAQDTELRVQFEGKDSWERIFDTRLTSSDGAVFYERSFVFPARGVPVALRFETRGYGTQGIAYVEIVNDDGRFVPDALRSVMGRVIDPQHVLADNVYYALAGERYTVENFNSHESFANQRRHGFEISLKRA